MNTDDQPAAALPTRCVRCNSEIDASHPLGSLCLHCDATAAGMVDDPEGPAPMRGLRLGVEQERRLRDWPTERIRPKSVALGVRSLLAEVAALRAENADLAAQVAELRAAIEAMEWKPERAMSGTVRMFCSVCHNPREVSDLRRRLERTLRADGHRASCALAGLLDILAHPVDSRGADLLAAAREMAEALIDVRLQVHMQEHGGSAREGVPAEQCDRWVCAIVNRALVGPSGEGGPDVNSKTDPGR